MKKKTIVVTFAVALASFLVTRVIWPDLPGGPQPTPGQLPFFVFLSVVESFTFGFAVALLLFGWLWFKNVLPERKNLRVITFLSFVWLLGQWWVHDNLHRVNGENMQGLLYIEYGFHVTIIIASFIILYSAYASVKNRQPSL